MTTLLRITMTLSGSRVYVLIRPDDTWSVVLPGDYLDVTARLTREERAKVAGRVEREKNR